MENMLSGRLAAESLAALTGIGQRQARCVVESGLAGRPLVERGAHLYPSGQIERLVARRVLDPDDVGADWSGLLVLRRPVPATLGWRERADALSPSWNISPVALARAPWAAWSQEERSSVRVARSRAAWRWSVVS